MSESPILQGTRYGTKGRERSFIWSHIALRLVWNIMWLLLAAWTPPQLYAWRRLLLIAFGADMAKGARVYGSARIWYPPNLSMGKGAVLGWQSYAYTQDRIVIEDYAIVSQFARLITGTHDPDSENFQLYTKPIRICAHAWVAAAAFVGPGVTIGEGAVLGGAAVTFRDLEPWTIYAGNPAKPIRPRRRFAGDGAGDDAGPALAVAQA
ncbi:putative colanic acid biosynthesis acetyltransferase [Sphingobium aquiterrae]|uniref:putative colanic acid biosynthesis acetyltransferase n=1 Tax=Sphingobium aquiterrae TaxID=2038656 RepID=UPI003016DC78